MLKKLPAEKWRSAIRHEVNQALATGKGKGKQKLKGKSATQQFDSVAVALDETVIYPAMEPDITDDDLQRFSLPKNESAPSTRGKGGGKPSSGKAKAKGGYPPKGKGKGNRKGNNQTKGCSITKGKGGKVGGNGYKGTGKK